MTEARGEGQLAGRRILVTGASAGIGAAVVRATAGAGAQVAVMARRRDRLQALADELGVVVASADVTDVAETGRAVDAATRELGGLDGLVNAAGILRGGTIAETDPTAWRELFDVNVLGLLHVTQAAIPHLVASDHADVVNLSSMSGRRLGSVEMAAYAASKAAVHMLTEGLRRELTSDGVRVSVVAPGFVRTEIFDAPGDAFGRRMGDKAADVGLEPEDVAAAVVHVLAAPRRVVHAEVAVVSVDQG